MEIESRPVSVVDALGTPGIEQPLALESYDFLATRERIRVISELQTPFRRPPEPDPTGRRYYWIDGLGVAAGHPERDSFDSHADQCFFELVDNVHRWAKPVRAAAVVSATSGGGDRSNNRLQIVVLDDGVGIVDSVKAKAIALSSRGHPTQCVCIADKPDSEIAEDVISDLLCSVFGNRAVLGAQGGHGLNTIARHVSRWEGTMNVVSSFAPDRAIHLGRRGSTGGWHTSVFPARGIKGTLVHLTLDVVNQKDAVFQKLPSPELRHKVAAV